MKTRAVTLEEQGPPSVMSLETVDIGQPGPNEVQIEQNIIGFNYMDIYQRSGLYPLDLPSGIGLEAAGIIHAVGENVTEFKEGDRAAYATAPQGAYAEYRNFPASRVVHLPDNISDEQCAATLFKGMTVEYLLNRCYDTKKDEKVLYIVTSKHSSFVKENFFNEFKLIEKFEGFNYSQGKKVEINFFEN